MPPQQRKKFVPKKHEHCFVWVGADGKLSIRCPHCQFVKVEIDVSLTYTEEQLRFATESSRDGHKRYHEMKGSKRAPVRPARYR